MASATATRTALSPKQLERVRRAAFVRRAVEANDHYQPVRERQRERLTDLWTYLSYARIRHGDVIEISKPQLANAIDLIDEKEREGLTVRQIKDRCDRRIENLLEYSARMGLLERADDGRAWETKRQGGEGLCIVLRLTSAGVAQSVRTAESAHAARDRAQGARAPAATPRRARPECAAPPGKPPPDPPCAAAGGQDERGLGRAFQTGELSPRPADSSAGSSRPSPFSAQREAVGASAVPATAHKAATELGRRAEAALAIRLAVRGNEETGARLVAELPWLAELAELQPTALARAAVRARYGPDAPWQAISAKWQQRLELAVRRIGRYADFGRGRPGVAAALIIDIVLGGAEVHFPGSPPTPPRSLGAVAVTMDQIARKWRATDRWATGRRAGFSPPEARGHDNNWHRWRQSRRHRGRGPTPPGGSRRAG